MLWKGTFLLLIGQAVSLLAGYGINVLLARQLGPVQYGTYGVVQSILMIIELSVIAGVPHALKRFIGENPQWAYRLHQILLPGQLLFAMLLFALTYVLAPQIAEFLKAPDIVTILQIALLDVIFFGAYWYFNGFVNGQRKFAQQTIIVSAYTISKFIFVAVLVAIGWGVTGAFIGNILGSIVGMIAGLLFYRFERAVAEVAARRLISFIIPSILYAVAINLLFYVDLWFVKRNLSDFVVGLYTAASTIGKIPYFFSAALTGAILPLLSQAIATNQHSEVQKIIRQSTRSLLLVLLPASVLVIADAEIVLKVLFGAQYAGAKPVLQILFPSLCGLTLLAAFNTMSMAKHGMAACSVLLAFTVSLDAILNAVLVPRFQELGAATATGLSILFGLVASILLLLRHFGTAGRLLSSARLIGSALPLAVLAAIIQVESLALLVVKAAIILLVYFLLLYLSGEITRMEIDRARAFLISLFFKEKQKQIQSL